MLAKGNRVMVLASQYDMRRGSVGYIDVHNYRDIDLHIVDFAGWRETIPARHLAQLPLPKEVRHAE